MLCGADPTGIELSSRTQERLAAARSDEWWVKADTTTVVRDDAGKTLWWTFAGWKANLWLAALAAEAGCRETVNTVDDLTISLDPDTDVAKLRSAVGEADLGELVLAPWITAEAIDGLKFAECLPPHRAVELVARRLEDPKAVEIVREEPLNTANPVAG